MADYHLSLLLFIESGGIGGAEKVIIQLAKEYKARGHSVHVLTLRKGWLTEQLHNEGITTIHIDSNKKLDFFLPWKIARIIKDNAINILHTHSIDSSFYGSIAAKLSGIKHIATEHGEVHHIVKKKFYSLKIKLVSALCSKITAVSTFTKEKLLAAGVSKRKCSVIYNPIVFDSSPQSNKRTQTRAQLGIEDDFTKHWLWLHVANVRPVKDQETLVEGFLSSLTTAPMKQTLCIVGDGPLRKELEDRVRSKNLSSHVLFLGHQDNPEPFYAAADGFILTSLSEALPMSLLEAAKHSLFPLCTRVGGIPEVVTPQYGILIEPQNPERLSHEISSALKNPLELKEKAKLFYAFAKQTFDSNKISEQYLQLCKELL